MRNKNIKYILNAMQHGSQLNKIDILYIFCQCEPEGICIMFRYLFYSLSYLHLNT